MVLSDVQCSGEVCPSRRGGCLVRYRCLPWRAERHDVVNRSAVVVCAVLVRVDIVPFTVRGVE